MAEATIGALANLATATAAYRGVVATLTEANARLVKQLKDNSNELRELMSFIKTEQKMFTIFSICSFIFRLSSK
jgi:hypothetical protein